LNFFIGVPNKQMHQQTQQQHSPLIDAVNNGDASLVENLLKHGANVNVRE